MPRSLRLPILLLVLASLLHSVACVTAQQQQQQQRQRRRRRRQEEEEEEDTLVVFRDAAPYAYKGCYNETTAIAGSDGSRALEGGPHEVLPGQMTVQKCLAFCQEGKQYQFAGIEYSRECWCGTLLSGLANKLDEPQCNLGCDGDQNQVCGGSLKLTVYELSAARDAAAPTALVLVLASWAATCMM